MLLDVTLEVAKGRKRAYREGFAAPVVQLFWYSP
jgi:hypothetical protein